MKLKDILYGLGLKPSTREYPYEIDSFTLPGEGQIQFARWQHPSERRKHFSQGMIDALRRFLRPGDVAVDIGAHTGDTTLPMALATGYQGLVLALEPNPYAFKILQTNAALNRDKTNIRPLMFAATAEDGVFEFEYSDAGFCNGGLHRGISPWKHAHFFKLQVTGRNLVNHHRHEFAAELPRIRYIKIDTEGYDRQVASSLRELLVAKQPFLKTEIYKHLPSVDRAGYFRDLRALGYRLHKFNHDEDWIGPELAEQDMMNWKHFDVFAIPEGETV